MRKYFRILKKTKLFEGLAEKEIEAALNCLGKKTVKFKKGDIIIDAGEPVKDIALLLNGSVQILQEDIEGNRAIIAQFYPSEIFAEALACAQARKSPVTAAAATDCEIIFIPFSKITGFCSESCRFHSKIISNMLKILAQKNIFLNAKIEHLSKRTIREKLISYLNEQSRKAGNKKFDIPFDRSELADFLFIDRSAMSRELCKMRDDCIIEFDKNRFILKK
ncbi:MAG: Crp/Fnr family transcriptional regulator [Endomicrobia bacterium]|nr:Crp/Fnr family transcriptional regulator [Endomicrobiia bacterium]